jgi:signal transduction histidine kinase
LGALRIRVDNLARYVTPDGVEEHRLLAEETERLALILDGLLALARAERDEHRWVCVDAAVVADERVAAWLPMAELRGMTLRRTGVPSAPVRAVATAVDQSVDALVDNALKFAGRGAEVEVSVVRADGAVEVSVRDDGPGLSEVDRAHATERLWRAPAVQNVPGAGLGLPIAAVLMAASRGSLELSAAQPSGLCVTLRLPADGDGGGATR